MTELRPAIDPAPSALPEQDEPARIRPRRPDQIAPRNGVEAAAEQDPAEADAVSSLRDRLQSKNVAVRLTAVAALGRLGGPTAVDVLLSALADHDNDVRSGAADALAAHGSPPVVDALCDALRRRDRYTRIAAAETLGAVGDPRAVPHLLEAHRRCFLVRSARRQLLLCLGLVAVVSLTFVAFIWGTFGAKLTSLAGCSQFLIRGVFAYLNERKEQSLVAAAISDALLKIAENSSAPEIHRIVPELRSVMRDPLQHSRETRVAAREAADRIEALTARLQQLSVATGAADLPVEDALPRPAGAPAVPAGQGP